MHTRWIQLYKGEKVRNIAHYPITGLVKALYILLPVKPVELTSGNHI